MNRGRQRLRRYVDKHYEGSVHRFARENGLEPSEIGKILRGQKGDRMSVKLAAKIEDATGGDVTVRMWVE